MVSNQSGPLQGQAGIFLFDENVEALGNDYVYNSLALIDSTLSRQKNDAEAIFGSLEYFVHARIQASRRPALHLGSQDLLGAIYRMSQAACRRR